MKIITNQPKNFEMVWATRISTNNLTDMHQWKFESQTRNVQTTIDNKTMKDIAPAGQWVICDFRESETLLEIKKIKPLQGLTGDECYQLINFHFCVFRFVRPPVPVSSGQAFRCDPASMI